MWLFTTFGFFSVITPKENAGRGPKIEKNKVMIRARLRSHLEALQDRYPLLAKSRILQSPAPADYHWRLIADRVVWGNVVRDLVVSSEITNFKSAAALEAKTPADHRYVHALHQVWAIMDGLQREAEAENQHP